MCKNFPQIIRKERNGVATKDNLLFQTEQGWMIVTIVVKKEKNDDRISLTL